MWAVPTMWLMPSLIVISLLLALQLFCPRALPVSEDRALFAGTSALAPVLPNPNYGREHCSCNASALLGALMLCLLTL